MSDPLRDEERQQASDALRAHFTAGRLDVDEFSSRLDEVWAASTREELNHVFRELPPLAPVAAPVWSPPVMARTRHHPVVWVVVAVLATIGFLTLWPAWLVRVVAWFVLVRPRRCAMGRGLR